MPYMVCYNHSMNDLNHNADASEPNNPGTGEAFGTMKPNSNPVLRAVTRTLSDSKAVLCAYLMRRMPRTQQGQLAGILRPDLLDAHKTPGDYSDVSDFPEEAFVEFNFDEGFPALPDGKPVWFRLDYEGPELFAAFQKYVDLIDEGPRHVAQLLDDPELQMLLGDDLCIDNLRNLYYLYYWKDRAHAHDTFQDAAYRHIRMRRALATEDHAYLKSTAMLTQVEGIMNTPEFWKQLEFDPKVALDYLKELNKIRRISTGLPANAPALEESTTSFEMIMRKVQESTRSLDPNSPGGTVTGGAMMDENGHVIHGINDQSFMRAALDNKDTARMMQEVVIRMTQAGGATKKPRWVDRAVRTRMDSDDVDHDDNNDIPPDGSSDP